MPNDAHSSVLSGAPAAVEIVVGLNARRTDAERELERDGLVLPLPQRAEWLNAVGYRDSILVIVRADNDAPVTAAGIGVGPTRALPGHVIYRIERLGASPEPHADRLLLDAIIAAAVGDRRCLRLHLELFDRSAGSREALGASLRDLGFVRSPLPTGYERTLGLDLSAPEEQLFGRLSSSARRNVRAPAKRGFAIRPVDDLSFVPRLESLSDEVFRRTGGSTRRLPWSTIVNLSRRSPRQSRIAGLFDSSMTGVESLVAFAWGCLHGDYVTYEAGAATRTQATGNLALAYAPLWDLVAWARGLGAAWFDFGGVSMGTAGDAHDPLGGIADFKRFFCNEVISVGEDWVLEPRPARAFLARAVRAAARKANL